MTYVDLGDVELRVDQWGSGQPLVLLHGYTGSGMDFVDVAPRLALDRRVLAITQRGHGESSNAADPASYRFSQLEEDLARTLDKIGLESVDLLGHSMGGVVAMRFVLANPQRVRSLILMDTAAAPASPGDTALLDALGELAVEEGMAALWDRIGEMWSHGAPADITKVRDKVVSIDPYAFRDLGRELSRYPSMLGPLGRVTCPTTVIVGENDAQLRASAEDLASAIPHASLVVIAGGGHSPHADRPDAWVTAVLDHLSRC